MARIKGIVEFVETVAGTSINPPLPEHAVGDTLLVFAVADNIATAFATTGSSAGWTIGGQQQSAGTTTLACRAGWFWTVADTTEESLVIVSSSTTFAATAIVIEGAHASTPIDVSNGNGILISANPGTSVPFQAASVTVANAKALVFWTMFNSLSTPSPFPGIRTVSSHDTGAIGVGIGMIPQVATGASGTWDFYTEDHASTLQNSVSFTVAIRDAATPVYFPAYLDKTHAGMVSPIRGITASVRGEVNNATNTTLYTNMPAMGLKQSKKVFQYDDSTATFYDVTTAANNATTADFQMLNNSPAPAVNDYIAFCMDTPFPSLSLLCSTTGVAGVFVVEVLNGTTWTSTGTVSTTLTCWKYWVTTTLTNKIDTSFVVGTVTSLYLPPAMLRKIAGVWKTSTLNSVSGYWMRIRFTTAPTTNPTLSWMMPSEGICIYDASAALADSGGNPFHNSFSSTPSIYSTTISGPAGTFLTFGTGIAPYTPTGKLLIGTYTFGTARDIVDTGARSELGGVGIYLTDASYRQRFYYVGGYQAKDTYQNERNVYALQWDAATQTYSQGNTALTEISRWGCGQIQLRGTGAEYFNQLVAYGVPKVSGGTSGTPIVNTNFLNTFAIDYYYPIPLIRTGVCVLPIQFGGGDAVFITLDTLLLTFPRLTTEPDAFNPEPYCSMHVDPDYLGLIFDGRSGDVIKLTNSVISSDSSWRFEFLATASASATWDFSGTSIINAKVTLKAVTTFDSMSFASCKLLDFTGCTVTNANIKQVPAGNDTLTTNASTVISGSAINVTGVTAGNRWVSVASPVIFASNAFTGSSTTGHAMRITSTVGSPFAFTGNTFTSFGPTVFGFHTTNDVNATTDVVTKASHGYTTADPIIYMKQGGAVNMGLTDATTYYVRSVSSSTISFHPTALDATNNTNITPLTSTGTETHYINSLGAAIFNDSGGAIVINISGGGTNPTIRNGVGASTTINTAVTVKVTVKDANTLATIENARVLMVADTGGNLPAGVVVTIANSGTTATVTHTSHGLVTGNQVKIKGASLSQNNGVFTITVTGASTYTYTMGSAPGSNPTGTITATSVILFGLTDASGILQTASFNYTNPQPVTGKVRRATAGTLTITATSGSGTVATLTFATQGSTPFPTGTIIKVSGLVPSGYNGVYVSTGGSTTTVTYASTTTGSMTVAGTVANQLYKTGAITGTITASGLDTTVLLISDD